MADKDRPKPTPKQKKDANVEGGYESRIKRERRDQGGDHRDRRDGDKKG